MRLALKRSLLEECFREIKMLHPLQMSHKRLKISVEIQVATMGNNMTREEELKDMTISRQTTTQEITSRKI